MTDVDERRLSDLEYVVLGLISVEPQSGYSIISTFETGQFQRWSASPGSIYPMLKRLEQSDYVEGNLEGVHETRPRKMYSLTPKGEDGLDAWIRAAPTKQEISELRDVMLLKFLFSENRLSHEEVLAWLDRYEGATDQYEKMFHLQRAPELDVWSTHQLLVVEEALMELSMQRSWIQMARHRLNVERMRSESRE
jgi:DNA-binding PadR family transcriptional regulator